MIARCRIVLCPNHVSGVQLGRRRAASAAHYLCPLHLLDYQVSAEAKNPTPRSLPDFIERTWKETQTVKANEKWANATEAEREEWKKGGFGR